MRAKGSGIGIEAPGAWLVEIGITVITMMLIASITMSIMTITTKKL